MYLRWWRRIGERRLEYFNSFSGSAFLTFELGGTRSDMKQIDTIQFLDIESNDEALIIVRASNERIAFSVSKRKGGDIEVVLRPEEGKRLLEALRQALSSAIPPTD